LSELEENSKKLSLFLGHYLVANPRPSRSTLWLIFGIPVSVLSELIASLQVIDCTRHT